MVLIQESLDISSLNELRKTVNHRIGGLELFLANLDDGNNVNHRIGGLEFITSIFSLPESVNHRIGGLELLNAVQFELTQR